MGGKTFEITDDNFQSEVVNSEEAVLVYFWAPWCGPCRQIAPMIDQLADEYAGSVKIGKLNIDENPQVTSQFGIQGIPTLMIFKGGEVTERFVGIPPRTRLTEALNSAKEG